MADEKLPLDFDPTNPTESSKPVAEIQKQKLQS